MYGRIVRVCNSIVECIFTCFLSISVHVMFTLLVDVFLVPSNVCFVKVPEPMSGKLIFLFSSGLPQFAIQSELNSTQKVRIISDDMEE